MKKNQITALAMLIFSVFCFSQTTKTILNPKFEVKNTGIQNIAKIELTDSTTRIHIHNTFIPKWWVQFSQNDSIVDVKTKKSYKAIAIEGAVFDKKLWMPNSGDSTIVLIYPKLNNVTKIDYNGQIFGISLTESAPKTPIKTELPADVAKWINGKLANYEKKKPMEYNTNTFFRNDTAQIVGYIKGYDPRLGFTTGMIYSSNLITNEDYPTVVQIYPDGRFEAKFILNHPIYSYCAIKNQVLEFYIEPGQVLSMVLDWNEFLIADRLRNIRYKIKGIKYGGALAKINTELFNYPKKESDYREFQKKLTTLTPNEFKAEQQQAIKDKNEQLISYSRANPLTKQAFTILKNDILIEHNMKLFDYISSRDYLAMSKTDTTNQILKVAVPDDYYDFLKDMPLNDISLLVDKMYPFFVNRFEFCKPLNQQRKQIKNDPEEEKINLVENWRLKDSVLYNSLQLKPTLTYEIVKIRSLKFSLKYLTKQTANKYWDTLKKGITNTELLKIGSEIIANTFADNTISSYELPKGPATDAFKKIIDPYKGKILFVDFWATSCGPCVSGIKRMKPTREKYKDNTEFDFIFITDEGSSPIETYNKLVSEQELKNTFRISKDDFHYLRQLFKFNGIPRYVVIDKEGKVINDNFSMHNFEVELGKILMAK